MRLFAVVACLLPAIACQTSLDGFGATPAEAFKHAGDGMQSHALRFDDVVRDTKFSESRALMSRYALIPSRLFGDSTVWNFVGARDSTRALTVDGRYDPLRGGYTFRATTGTSQLDALGSSRHVLRLQHLRDGAYSWDTSVDQAVGTMPAARAAQALRDMLASAESNSARDLRSESRVAYPRSARALGRLLSLDSARSRSLPDGSSEVALSVSWHSQRLRPAMPYFAAYVAKYIEPSVYRITLSDRRGRRYFDITGDNGKLLVQWRSRRGALLPLEGGSDPMPDTLRIRMDFNTRYKMFRVGFAELTGDFIVQRGPNVAGWFMRFRTEPKWQLPLFTETLIRAPLRRPFQGRGCELYLALRDGGAQTLLVRQTHAEVQESPIIRWLGSLGATAMSDFQGRTETEENRFLSEGFAALRADAQQLLGSR